MTRKINTKHVEKILITQEKLPLIERLHILLTCIFHLQEMREHKWKITKKIVQKIKALKYFTTETIMLLVLSSTSYISGRIFPRKYEVFPSKWKSQ